MGKLLRKAQAQKEKNMLGDLYQRILALAEKEGEEFKIQRDAIISELDAVKIEIEKEIVYSESLRGTIWDFSKERRWNIFVENSMLLIRPIHETEREEYLQIKKEQEVNPDRFQDEKECNEEWEIVKNEKSFVCSVILKTTGDFIGYVSIKDTASNLWEVAIELLKEYCHKGYGKSILTMFLLKINEITKKDQFQALVESDNVASQILMEKMGAKLIDLYNYARFTEEEAEAFENDNLDKITDRMVMLAEQIEVEPKQLLSHVLDYRIFVEDGIIVDRSRKETK